MDVSFIRALPYAAVPLSQLFIRPSCITWEAALPGPVEKGQENCLMTNKIDFMTCFQTATIHKD